MSFALGAGKLFNVTGKGEYEETLVCMYTIIGIFLLY